MKNSPDPEWFNKMEKRLRDYTEEPDANVWNRIATNLGNEPEPIWMPWVHRLATLTSVFFFLWVGFNNLRMDAELMKQPITKQSPITSETETSSGQPGQDFPDVKRQRRLPMVYDRQKTYQGNKSKVIQPELTYDDDQTTVQGRSIQNQQPDTNLSWPLAYKRKPADYTNAFVITDSLNSEIHVTDSLHRGDRKTIIIPNRKKRALILYASLSTSLSYQKISPLTNDGVVIDKFHPKPIFSADRFGVGFEAGIQSKIAGRFEFFGGLSVYQQSQTLVYQYQSVDMVNMIQKEDFDYSLIPGTKEKAVKYNMLNLGAEAGMMYYLRGDRLAHKMGAGFSYQHGMQQVSESETYENAKSQYLFYHIFYRNEYTVNKSINIFIQPFYKHAILSAESLDEPFKVKPYRAGLSFGILYNFK